MDKVEQTLEIISARGCNYVRSFLLCAENGETLDEVQHLNSEEIASVTVALGEIMSVYET